MSDIIIIEVTGEASIVEVSGEPSVIEETVALDGKSAYEVALLNGFVGTEAQWLASLKGDKGDIGDTGAQGVPGATGATGATGAPGVGVPVGGSTNQVLRKKSATDYDTEWASAGAGDMTKAVYDTNNDGKVNAADAADAVPWTGVSGKPTTFTPAPHVHAIADVTGLQTALDGKAPTVHTHTIAQVTNLQTTLDGKAPTVHTHAIADVTGLQTALNGKAALVHTHVIGDVSGLQTALDGKAAVVHTHAIADVTGLQTALDGKQKTITSGTAAPSGGVNGDIYLQYV